MGAPATRVRARAITAADPPEVSRAQRLLNPDGDWPFVPSAPKSLAMTERSVTIRVVIRGRVQGVWYRGWVVARAGERGLDGWVRNLTDGAVEAVFAGPEPAVHEMTQACWQGPAAARVREVRQFAFDAPVARGFHQRPTR